jgi:hypothetical protein
MVLIVSFPVHKVLRAIQAILALLVLKVFREFREFRDLKAILENKVLALPLHLMS